MKLLLTALLATLLVMGIRVPVSDRSAAWQNHYPYKKLIAFISADGDCGGQVPATDDAVAFVLNPCPNTALVFLTDESIQRRLKRAP